MRASISKKRFEHLPNPTFPPPRAPLRVTTYVASIVATAILVGLVIVGMVGRPGDATRGVTRVRIEIPTTNELEIRGNFLALSPDGRRLVYRANDQLYSRRMDELEPTPIPGTEGGYSPFFSPDGGSVGFFTSTQLKTVSLRGGAPTTVTDTSNGLSAAWGPRDEIVFGGFGSLGLSRVSSTGGQAIPLTVLAEGDVDHDFASFLPGGDAVVFTALTNDTTWDNAKVFVKRLTTGERRIVLEGAAEASYVPTGHLVYARAGALLAVAFDLNTQQVVGTPQVVLEGIMHREHVVAQFSISENGSLAYVPAEAAGRPGLLVSVGRDGTERPVLEEPRLYFDPKISPDGSFIAVAAQEADFNIDVRIYDPARDTFRRLTFDPGYDFLPALGSQCRQSILHVDAPRAGPALLEAHGWDRGSVKILEPSQRALAPGLFTRRHYGGGHRGEPRNPARRRAVGRGRRGALSTRVTLLGRPASALAGWSMAGLCIQRIG